MRRELSWAAGAAVGLAAAVATVVLCYVTVPKRNTERTHFDALLVLGTPADADGRPSYSGKWLVDETAREYRAGRAAHIILSGGPVVNRYAEAHVLGTYAASVGVPRTAMIEDDTARDTLQNVRRCAAIMHAHGWRSVEVIGTVEHLPRAAVLMEHTDLLWATHAVPTPDRSWWDRARHTVLEAVAVTALRLFGLRTVPVLHRLRLRMRLP